MQGWRALHQDFIDNKLRVTWVDGTDDPANDIIELIDMREIDFIDMLAEERGFKLS